MVSIEQKKQWPKILEKISRKLESITARITGLHGYVNSAYVQEVYFPEVISDIQFLREGMQEAVYEQSKNNFFQHLSKKYTESYCPSTFYRFFTLDTWLEFNCLRVEINEILAQQNQ